MTTAYEVRPVYVYAQLLSDEDPDSQEVELDDEDMEDEEDDDDELDPLEK
jgi:hypothetical protein